jgi:hypothetical protein
LDSALTEVETQATETRRLLSLAQDTWALAIKSSRTGLSEDTLPVFAATHPRIWKRHANDNFSVHLPDCGAMPLRENCPPPASPNNPSLYCFIHNELAITFKQNNYVACI